MIEKFEEWRPALEERLIPMMEKLGETIVKIIEWFFGLSEEMQIGIGIVLALIPVLGILLMTFGWLMSSWEV
jgi:hypothetical protein